MEKLVWQHDGPFGDSSAIPTYMVSQLTREKVTVALNGDGGDELFAGYLRFWAATVTERVPRAAAAAGGPRGPPDSGEARAPGRLASRARRLLTAVERPLGDRLVRWNSYFAFDAGRDPAAGAGRRCRVRPAVPATVLRRGRWDAPRWRWRSHHNFHTYLPQDLLVKVDRTSMAHALETRSPFLDTALIEYVAGLPDSYKLRGRTTKYILRKAFADLLPPAIQSRGKMGFGLPLGTWFRKELRGYLRDLLLAPEARIRDYLQAGDRGAGVRRARRGAGRTTSISSGCWRRWSSGYAICRV